MQYSDCLIDTNAQIYLQNINPEYNKQKYKTLNNFSKLVNKFPNEPVYPSVKYNWDDSIAVQKATEEYETYNKAHEEWDNKRLKWIDEELSKTSEFQEVFQKAVHVAEEGYSNDEIGRYLSKEKALKLKRSCRVFGRCSQDDYPRKHTLNIAILSAEAINWEIFLPSHLDIMNDRFERISDGSYAWAGRKTYIQELEELDINVVDLLTGICLRIENPNKNHYFGSIGRALSESKDFVNIEKKILNMIEDNELDNYKRVLMYYLFLNSIKSFGLKL